MAKKPLTEGQRNARARRAGRASAKKGNRPAPKLVVRRYTRGG